MKHTPRHNPDRPAPISPNPNIPLAIVHEDPDLFIIDKPPGLVTQPGKGHASDSLLNALFALKDGLIAKLLTNLGQRRDFGLLHRLDKDTSGLLVVAKTPNAYDQLRRDFEARRIDKEYLALTAGIPTPAQGVIQARLKEVEIPKEAALNPDKNQSRDRKGAVNQSRDHKGAVNQSRDRQGAVGGAGGGSHATIKKAIISRQGQEALTAYKVLSSTPTPPAALVHLTIKTGRLHQIRAHMLFLHCHVLGDPLYLPPIISPRDYPHPPRLCLHATRLGFKHPTTQQWTHFTSPLPPDLTTYAKKLSLTP